MADKNFIKWSYKKVEFDNWWSLIRMSINVQDLMAIANDKWYASVVLSELRTPTEYSTHYLYENEWKPNQQTSKKQLPLDDVSLDMPF